MGKIEKLSNHVVGPSNPNGKLGPNKADVKNRNTRRPSDKLKVLKQDIVIPAGTIFHRSPLRRELIGDDHFEHVVGLTNDSCGELSYYVDPNDPELKEWFAEIDEEFDAVKNNIFLINDEPTLLDIPTERVLEAAKGKLKRVLVIGTEDDESGDFYFCSSTSNKKEVLWLIDNFKNQLLNGFRDMVDDES
jgi:hypothetical protein